MSIVQICNVQMVSSPLFVFPVKKGDRVAQLVCERICYPDLEEQEVICKLRNSNPIYTHNYSYTGTFN